MTEQKQALIDAYYENIGEWPSLSENEKEWTCGLKIDRDFATAELGEMAANRTWSANNGFAVLKYNINTLVNIVLQYMMVDIADEFLRERYRVISRFAVIAKQLRHLPGWTM